MPELASVLPKISLVTAVYNGEQFLEATIRSVLDQNYPNLEYIIIDDGSTDSTPDIIRKYQPQLAYSARQPNQGLFPALNAGFARTTGEIMGWLNSSDMLQVNGLFVVGGVFSSFPNVEWITGRPTKYNTSGQTVNIWPVPHWSRMRFLAGANKYIQQESTYWRRALWQRAGGYVHEGFRAEGDFELWVRFFRHAQLYSVDALIGGFRVHPDSLSLSSPDLYRQIHDEIIAAERQRTPWGPALAAFDGFSRAMLKTPVLNTVWRNTVMSALTRMPGPDWAPLIRYRNHTWTLR